MYVECTRLWSQLTCGVISVSLMACDSSFRWWLRLGSTTDTGCDTMCVLRALNRSTGKVLTEKQDHEQQILKTLPPPRPRASTPSLGGRVGVGEGGFSMQWLGSTNARRALKSGDRETRSFSVNRRFMLSLIINTLPHCIDIMNHPPPLTCASSRRVEGGGGDLTCQEWREPLNPGSWPYEPWLLGSPSQLREHTWEKIRTKI